MRGFSGDDIMLGLGGLEKFEGRLGFGWVSWENEDHGVSVDMERREFVDQPQALGGDAIRDFFIETEAASGSALSDVGVPLRVQATFIDGLGASASRRPCSPRRPRCYVAVRNPAVNHAPVVLPQISPPGSPIPRRGRL
jgi:hypothetical protein